MADIREWTRLKCDCGGEIFERVFYLKFRTGGGTTDEPAGYRCVACNGLADQQRMIKLVEINALNIKMRELKDEMGAKEAEAVAKK